ncbi:MAG: acyl-CoA transferase [Alphaproteobacteria bacterium]|nr:acyl-CoA transferase [Alphaproteobacteria bacterium]MBT6406731.1 acyl-CoA transferase [Rhodospirillaceae bacterium]
MSKTEQILEAIKTLLITVPGGKVERNSAVPEKIPTGGLIVLRDGDPGEPETALGGFDGVYYSHHVEIELYIEDGDATIRDTAFDTLVQSVGTVLKTDSTLGGLAFGMSYGRPEIDTEAVAGAPAIKTGTIIVTVEYETASPLG